MKIEYLLLSALMLIILSCQPFNKEKTPVTDTLHNKERTDLQLPENVNAVRTTLVDSLKWVLYIFNRENKAISEKTKNTVSPLACDLKLVEVNRRGKDTVIYYFDVFYKKEKYMLFPIDNIGVGTIKGSIKYLIGSHFVSDPIPRQLFLSNEALFTRHLKEYKGEINEWLKNEAIKRKVLK